MYHFFVPIEQISETKVLISGTDVNHISNVLRMRKGEKIAVLDGKGMEYFCEIREMDREIQADILEKRPVSSELPVKVLLFQGFPKGDKLENIIQKSVELGVYAVIPVITERTIVKLDDKKAAKKLERYNSIAEAAAKQAGRGMIPRVLPVMSYKEALRYALEQDEGRVLIPYELAENMEYTRSIISGIGRGETVSVFIGPEGGFSLSEVEQVIEAGGSPVTLGPRILRTETAGPALLAMMNYVLND